MADDDQRKTTSRELHDHLDEERTSVMLAMFESDGSEDDDDMSEYSDDSFQASSLRSGIEGEEVEYPDYDDYSNYEEIEEDDIDPDLLSYEELIALGELVGVESRGLSEAEITKSLHPSTFQSLTSKTLVDRSVLYLANMHPPVLVSSVRSFVNAQKLLHEYTQGRLCTFMLRDLQTI
ncbi:PREDICTED: E3 ubiquitin ligase BIG BROTHER-related-like isoform X2 [Ipomoea nil]|uniref:E3 ubiquitin ligase BIG BROTHER-related-like isoform X2 n=1 Tax=Ipomoea nil TaxID=35883 RepID=UPI0009014C65|nr:PREDICTED: E3 ubiquitin ligase BIG BROTHER-related-like isoform X2 [Ipomoea nil]